MAAQQESPGSVPQKGLLGWLNKRLPIDEFVKTQLTGYYRRMKPSACFSF